jgi:hypothetical protein
MDLEIVTCGCINVSRQTLLIWLGASQTKRAGKKTILNIFILVKQRRPQSAKIGNNYLATT